MTRRTGTILALLVLALAPAARAELDFMPLSEIRKGMTGHGLTVFEGTRIERFPVEVVDVMSRALPNQDLILVRCGGRAAVEKFGVAAGMSGSPIYLDGRLIGALAYGWDFSNEAIAGITPIEAMIRDTARPSETAGSARSGPAPADARGRLRPLLSPLVVSGLSPAVLARLGGQLASRHLMAIRGGGGGGTRPGLDDLRLEPGSACSVDLMRGDVSASIVGTITAVDGDRVLAFGHSFFDSGECVWPLSTAWINYTIGSPMSSFKMGETGRSVGRLVQDRQAGVAGIIGEPASMIPAVVRVKNGVTGREDTFRVEVVRDPYFTSVMLGSLIGQAISTAESGQGPSRIRTELRLRIAGREEPVRYRDLLTASEGVSAWGASGMIRRLLDNPFGEVVLEGMELDAIVFHDEGDVWIESVGADREIAAPGEEVTVRVTLRPRRGARTVVTVPVRIPVDAAPGRTLDLRVFGGDDAVPAVAPPDDVEGVIRLIEAYSPSTDLVVEVPVPLIDVTLRGRVVRSVPASVLEGLLPAGGSSAVGLQQAIVRSHVSLDRALRGSAVLKIAVAKPRR